MYENLTTRYLKALFILNNLKYSKNRIPNSLSIFCVGFLNDGGRTYALYRRTFLQVNFLVAFFVSYILCHTPRFSRKIVPIFCVIHIVPYTFIAVSFSVIHQLVSQIFNHTS